MELVKVESYPLVEQGGDFLNATKIIQRPAHDGVQVLVEFPNKWGASVVQHKYSYGGKQGFWELAVLAGIDEDESGLSYDLDYSTPITSDVLGWLTPKEVTETLREISELPDRIPQIEG